MQLTRGQQIDKKIEKYEDIVGSLLRFYDDDLRDLVVGSPDSDKHSAEVQIDCLLAMSYATRAIVAMKDLKIEHDKAVINNLHHLLKKSDPKFRPLEEIYKEQNEAERKENEEEEDDFD